MTALASKRSFMVSALGCRASWPALPLKRHRRALTYADAEGGERAPPPPGRLQLTHGSERQPRARGAGRMAEGDGAAVGIDLASVVGEPDAPNHLQRQRLGGEGLVQLACVKVIDRQAQGRSEPVGRSRKSNMYWLGAS